MDHPPVLETRQVLLNHLSAKVDSLKSIALTKDIVDEITENLSNSDIIFLLEHDRDLESRIENSKALIGSLDKERSWQIVCVGLMDDANNKIMTIGQLMKKQSLGEELFVAVSRVDSELCAQVTGMLLELDIDTIEKLIHDHQRLKQAVYKAKQEYIKYTQGNLKDAVGEELYDLVSERYPEQELASHLTGMILELDNDVLRRLTRNPDELDEKLNAAYSVLLSMNKNNEN